MSTVDPKEDKKNKIVTITLTVYLTSATIMLQGNRVKDFISGEFPHLKETVDAIMDMVEQNSTKDIIMLSTSIAEDVREQLLRDYNMKKITKYYINDAAADYIDNLQCQQPAAIIFQQMSNDIKGHVS